MREPPVEPDRGVLRWIVDCWQPGCGWSRVGWDAAVLRVEALEHRKERGCGSF